ncbi:hypothetical protein BC332_21108 [Capsicum chinense]|nr:hypothetical protein BC332_21108 [Capsicum chinense]
MATAGSRWAIVMSRGAGFSDQVVELDLLYPSEGIHRRWDASYRITSTAAMWDQTALVLSVPRRKPGDETQDTSKSGPRTFTLHLCVMGELFLEALEISFWVFLECHLIHFWLIGVVADKCSDIPIVVTRWFPFLDGVLVLFVDFGTSCGSRLIVVLISWILESATVAFIKTRLHLSTFWQKVGAETVISELFGRELWSNR